MADLFDEYAELVKTSFPNIRCLRCQHDRFYMNYEGGDLKLVDLGKALSPRPLAVVSLTCERCGHIEQHRAEILKSAQKPIAV